MTKAIWAGLFLYSLAFTLNAQEPELYGLTRRSEIISERGAVERLAWRTEDSTLSFIPPGKWDVAVKLQEKKLTLRYLPLLSGITIRVATNTPGSVPAWATAAVLRKQTMERFPDAFIREEFMGHSPVGTGMVIDIEVKRDDSRTCHRVAWFAFSGGLIELELVSPEKYFTMCHGAWITVLNSLQIDPVPKKGQQI